MTTITAGDIFGYLFVALLASYFIVGIVVLLFLFFRERKGPTSPLPMLIDPYFITLVVLIVAWPLLFMTYLDELDAEDEEPPTK